ncbi:MAG: cyclophilin-like fold protein [Thaumarchaeota archaeon]|nr:cyclophilin-like fold protein [Nitrososphaerota archaeon]
MSVSKVECKVAVRGKGDFTIDLYKHLAPITVSAILRALPLNARVTIYPKAMICILTGLKTGVEKQRLEYSKGEIAFLAANGSLCFFTSAVKSQSPLNPIGKVVSNPELLEKLSPGDSMEIIQVREIEEGAQT